MNILLKCAAAFSVLLSAQLGVAQSTFMRTYGGPNSDIAYSFQLSPDGGYLIAGYTLSFGQGNRDVYVIRADAQGNLLWSKTYGSTDIDYGWTVDLTSDGGFIVGAHSGSFGLGSHDVYLLKCDSVGNLEWTRVYGGGAADGAYSMQETTDSGFIIASHTSSFGAGQHEVYLIKTDSSGDTTWTRSYGGTGGDYLRSVQQTTDGGYITASETFSFGAGNADVYLVKTDSLGNLEWAKTYGGAGADYGYSVCQTTDGGFITCGYTTSAGAGGFDVLLLKTDALGNVAWSKTYGGISFDYGYEVRQTADGGFVVCGHSGILDVAGDVYLLRTDSLGDLLWSRSIGGAGSDYGWMVEETLDSGFAIAGCTSSFGAGGSDVLLIKTDASGATDCNNGAVMSLSGDFAPQVSVPMTTVSGGAGTTVSVTITAIPATVDSLVCSVPIECRVLNPGDVNMNGLINSSDIIFLVNYVFKGSPNAPMPCEAAGDINCSAEITSADLIALVNYVFKAGLAPCDVCPLIAAGQWLCM